MLRLTLEDEATEAVNKMLEELKAENAGISLSPSGLATWVLIYFSNKQFKRFKKRIAGDHFNPKAFMRSRLKNLDSPEKFQEFLKEVQSKMKNTKGVIKEKTGKESMADGILNGTNNVSSNFERIKK